MIDAGYSWPCQPVIMDNNEQQMRVCNYVILSDCAFPELLNLVLYMFLVSCQFDMHALHARI